MRSRRASIVAGLLLVTLAAVTVAVAACGSSSTSSATSPSTSPSAAGFDLANVKADSSLNAMLPAAIKSAGTIRVATSMPYPPWEMYTAVGSNKATGLDYDLSQAIAARLGVKASFDQTVFDAIMPALLADKEDVVMAGMWDTPQRQKVLNFVDYAKDGYGIAVLKGNPANIQTVDDLAGKTLAYESGDAEAGQLRTLQAKFKTEGKPALTVLPFPTTSDALLAVSAGKAQAMITGLSATAYMVKTSGGGTAFQLVHGPSWDATFGTGIAGIGILKKANPQMINAVQKALQSLIADGTYSAILDKYGLGSLAVTSVGINQGK